MTDGIYILANDGVIDQLIALINSIRLNAGSIPICILPYDDRVDGVRSLISQRNDVTLFDDTACIQKWEDFATQIWQSHPTVRAAWTTETRDFRVHRLGMHRRFCGFDGPFDRFIYLDADTLVLDSLRPIFDGLTDHDFVVYDFQHKDLTHVFQHDSPQLYEVFAAERLERELFCAGMYASKQGIFSDDQLAELLQQLRHGEVELLYGNAPDQSILNYMVLRSHLSSLNLALHWSGDRRTGNSVTSSHFEPRDHRLYDRGKPLMYLHYIGLPSTLFRQVSAGENIDFPYRDTFLYYRFLHEPAQRPIFRGRPKAYNAPPSFVAKLMQKLRLAR
ncbi:MAG: Npun_R2821/Npun_R2822 family protein [Elainellaceae cyanobacterium]